MATGERRGVTTRVTNSSNRQTRVRKIFDGRIFSVVVESIVLPNGLPLEAELIRHPGSVVLVPVTDSGEIVLVRQYRPAVNQWLWELPAGSLKPGEDIEAAARRECHEEIGLIPERLEKLGAFYPTPGFCDELMHVYRASSLRSPLSDEVATPDDDEDIEIGRFGPDQIRQMIASGELVDLKTLVAVGLEGAGLA